MALIWTSGFWADAAERAVRTAAQAALALVGADGLGVREVGWAATATVAGLAAAASLLTSLAASRVGPATASLLSPGRHARG